MVKCLSFQSKSDDYCQIILPWNCLEICNDIQKHALLFSEFILKLLVSPTSIISIPIILAGTKGTEVCKLYSSLAVNAKEVGSCCQVSGTSPDMYKKICKLEFIKYCSRS